MVYRVTRFITVTLAQSILVEAQSEAGALLLASIGEGTNTGGEEVSKVLGDPEYILEEQEDA